jgi:phosphonate transport system substrate-binding protein
VDRAQGEVFAKIQYANGDAGYYSVLITNVNSRFKTLDDVFKNTKDVTLGFGDPNSTSGTLMPGYYLFAKHNTPVNTSFKTMLPSSHEANLLAVVNNKIDIATNNTEMLDTLKKEHPDKFAQVRVLWKSPLIPSDPLVWRKDLPQATKDKLRNFFLNYAKTDPREKEIVMKISKRSQGFKESSDKQLMPIRQLDLVRPEAPRSRADTVLSDADQENAPGRTSTRSCPR